MRNRTRNLLIVLFLGISVIVVVSVLSAVAASNTVEGSRADVNSKNISGNDLKPDACAGINITNIVDVGSGETGTGGNDLIFGTSGNDFAIQGGAGDDCILGGGGNEGILIFIFPIGGIYGEDGDDVLIGGPGFDICRGGGGNNTFIGCEIER